MTKKYIPKRNSKIDTRRSGLESGQNNLCRIIGKNISRMPTITSSVLPKNLAAQYNHPGPVPDQNILRIKGRKTRKRKRYFIRVRLVIMDHVHRENQLIY
jgi:hypothetical protein